jgi:hypothetical protein
MKNQELMEPRVPSSPLSPSHAKKATGIETPDLELEDPVGPRCGLQGSAEDELPLAGLPVGVRGEDVLSSGAISRIPRAVARSAPGLVARHCQR